MSVISIKLYEMKIYVKLFVLIFFGFSFLNACQQTTKPVEVKKNDSLVKTEEALKFSFHRYEKALFAIQPNNLSTELGKLIPEYSFFLGDQWQDPAKQRTLFNYLTDKNIVEIFNEVQVLYPDLISVEKELIDAFTILRKHFPDLKKPEVYTYVSGLDVEMPVIYTDSVLAIALDVFLGAENKVYKKAGIPRYRASRCGKQNLLPSVMYAIGGGLMTIDGSRQTLLDIMIAEGKALYVADLTLPEVPDHLKIGYSVGQLEWCKANEQNIWALLIENQLLYSSDREKTGKFFLDGPTTQGLVEQSPGRLASYVGWQIVSKYMESGQDISLKELLANTNSQEILSKSGYKPKK